MPVFDGIGTDDLLVDNESKRIVLNSLLVIKLRSRQFLLLRSIAFLKQGTAKIEVNSKKVPEGTKIDSDQLEVVIRRSQDRMSNMMESLILAQNERWRRVLSMQVERQGAAMCPRAADW